LLPIGCDCGYGCGTNIVVSSDGGITPALADGDFGLMDILIG